MKDETPETSLSHAIKSSQDIAVPNFTIFETPSGTFTQVNVQLLMYQYILHCKHILLYRKEAKSYKKDSIL